MRDANIERKTFDIVPGRRSGYHPKCDRTLSAINSARHRRTCRGTRHATEKPKNELVTGRYEGKGKLFLA